MNDFRHEFHIIIKLIHFNNIIYYIRILDIKVPNVYSEANVYSTPPSRDLIMQLYKLLHNQGLI